MSDPQKAEPLPLEDCFPVLLEDKRVAKLANEIVGGDPKKVMELAGKPDPFSHEGLAEFHDALLELLDEAEAVDSATIECLSSYSTDTTFELMSFAGVFFIKNFEFGDIGYFLSAEEAKKAADASAGFKWDDPQASRSDSKVQDLLDEF